MTWRHAHDTGGHLAAPGSDQIWRVIWPMPTRPAHCAQQTSRCTSYRSTYFFGNYLPPIGCRKNPRSPLLGADHGAKSGNKFSPRRGGYLIITMTFGCTDTYITLRPALHLSCNARTTLRNSFQLDEAVLAICSSGLWVAGG